jgi:predicted acyltransferase
VPAPAPAAEIPTGQLLNQPVRLASVDAYRGLVMLLMMAEVLQLKKVAAALPDVPFWKDLA